MIVYEYQRDIKQHLQTHAFTVHEMRLYKNTTELICQTSAIHCKELK